MNTQVTELQEAIASINAEIVVKEAEIEGVQYEVDHFEYSISESEYDAYLDERYEGVNVCGFTYSASYALKELDPIAYRCMKSDYESDFDLDDCTEYTDMTEDLDNLNDDLGSLNSELQELQGELDDLESEAE